MQLLEEETGHILQGAKDPQDTKVDPFEFLIHGYTQAVLQFFASYQRNEKIPETIKSWF